MADTSTLAPASYKQPSRKGKKAWRKNVDVSQVTTGLEDARAETLTGGIIAEKPSDALFATDVAGDAQLAKQQASSKLLKADEILARRSAVPGLERRKRKAEEAIVSSAKKSKNGTYVTHKELQNLKRTANLEKTLEIAEPGAAFDPWAPKPRTLDPRFTFLEEKKDKVEPATLRHAPVAQTATGKPLPNVRKPEAGKSYNPLVGDWTALLEREGAAAVADEKARLQAEAEAADAEARATEEARKVEEQERDAYGTDYESAWESEWEGIASGNEGAGEGGVWTAKMQKRKTPAERNKVKARKEREAREKWEVKQKVHDEQEKRIEALAKEARAKDLAKKGSRRQLAAARDVAAESSASDDDDGAAGEPKLRKTRFGKVGVPEAPMEIMLGDELRDSLRRLKPQGNPLQERYRNLLVNGKVEARKPIWQRKKAQRQATEKWTYKDFKV